MPSIFEDSSQFDAYENPYPYQPQELEVEVASYRKQRTVEPPPVRINQAITDGLLDHDERAPIPVIETVSVTKLLEARGGVPRLQIMSACSTPFLPPVYTPDSCMSAALRR
jgi:hypothetical protein